MGPQEYYRKDKRDFKIHPRTAKDRFLNDGRLEKVVYGMFPVFVRMVLMKEKKEAS